MLQMYRMPRLKQNGPFHRNGSKVTTCLPCPNARHPNMMSSEEVTKLKTQIVAAYDRAPAKYKLQEGEGHVLTLGLSPRDLSKLCVATAPLQHLAAQLSFLFQHLLPRHKFSTITVRD